MSCDKSLIYYFHCCGQNTSPSPAHAGQGTPSGNAPPPYFLEAEDHPPKRAQGNKPENVCGFASYCPLIRYH